MKQLKDYLEKAREIGNQVAQMNPVIAKNDCPTHHKDREYYDNDTGFCHDCQQNLTPEDFEGDL